MITRRTFIRTSALAVAGLALAGGPIALAGCAPDGDVLRVGTKIDVPGFGFQNPRRATSRAWRWTSRASWPSASRATRTRSR